MGRRSRSYLLKYAEPARIINGLSMARIIYYLLESAVVGDAFIGCGGEDCEIEVNVMDEMNFKTEASSAVWDCSEVSDRDFMIT
ncbi:MAG: hypothetical protein ACTSXX_04210 [Candidatus Baldrarchaeia archaeon]